jgi:hypothetical protein
MSLKLGVFEWLWSFIDKLVRKWFKKERKEEKEEREEKEAFDNLRDVVPPTDTYFKNPPKKKRGNAI